MPELDHMTGASDSSDYMQVPVEPQKTLPTYAVLPKTCKHTLSLYLYVYNWWVHPLKLKRSDWTTVWNYRDDEGNRDASALMGMEE